ncbi:hypothetical protein TorRG33x02_139450 [Trema orientale]|uniref:Uncharacterized protein n=1 Tax=Trema orientale TaxID=63057 RepID=A0A2P5EXM6_TREOI|nr:hypothetical protein TorRG33x02_139450 [Trema orientale]
MLSSRSKSSSMFKNFKKKYKEDGATTFLFILWCFHPKFDFKNFGDDVPQLVSTFELPRESNEGLGGEDKGEEEHRTGTLGADAQPEIDDMITELSSRDIAARDQDDSSKQA